MFRFQNHEKNILLDQGYIEKTFIFCMFKFRQTLLPGNAFRQNKHLHSEIVDDYNADITNCNSVFDVDSYVSVCVFGGRKGEKAFISLISLALT